MKISDFIFLLSFPISGCFNSDDLGSPVSGNQGTITYQGIIVETVTGNPLKYQPISLWGDSSDWDFTYAFKIASLSTDANGHFKYTINENARYFPSTLSVTGTSWRCDISFGLATDSGVYQVPPKAYLKLGLHRTNSQPYDSIAFGQTCGTGLYSGLGLRFLGLPYSVKDSNVIKPIGGDGTRTIAWNKWKNGIIISSDSKQMVVNGIDTASLIINY